MLAEAMATMEGENLMPTGPRGEKRPADMVGAAVMVARLSVGDATEAHTKASGRVRSGHAGAKARVEATTGERRREIAKKAAEARWA